jgi:hypothetical protein
MGGMGGSGGAGGQALDLGKIAVTVSYQGMAQGPLIVAAYTTFPPTEPPVTSFSAPMPTFPAIGNLNDLEPGTYFVTATIDVGNDNPMGPPGPGDPVAVTMPPVSVAAGDTKTANLILMAPL